MYKNKWSLLFCLFLLFSCETSPSKVITENLPPLSIEDTTIDSNKTVVLTSEIINQLFEEQESNFDSSSILFWDTIQTSLDQRLNEKAINSNQCHIFIRCFKLDGRLELWAKPIHETAYTFIKPYPFCMLSGKLGPKRKEGDDQVPEGVYYINHFNPESNYHLSLGLNFPNASELVRNHPTEPGSAIYIHGGCISVGCIPIQDDNIEEVYGLADKARLAGQVDIPVHIFPADFNTHSLDELALDYPQHLDFWKELLPIFEAFENDNIIPNITIDANGKYHVEE